MQCNYLRHARLQYFLIINRLIIFYVFNVKTFNIILSYISGIGEMCKRNFVAVSVAKRKYKILADDISKVHTFSRKKLPPVPSF